MRESSAKLLRRMHKLHPLLTEEHIFESVGQTFRTGTHREKGKLRRQIEAMIARARAAAK